MAAVGESGQSIEFAAEALRGDFDVVLAALKSDGMAFIFLTAPLNLNPDLAMLAVLSRPDLIYHMPAGWESPDRRAMMQQLNVLAELSARALRRLPPPPLGRRR